MIAGAAGPAETRPTARPPRARCRIVARVAGPQDVWICAADLQLIRADRVISLLVPAGPGRGAAPPGDRDLHYAVYAEVRSGTHGDTSTRVKLADCGGSQAASLLAGLAVELTAAASADGCSFVFAERNAGNVHWASARHLPPGWPQSPPPGS